MKGLCRILSKPASGDAANRPAKRVLFGAGCRSAGQTRQMRGGWAGRFQASGRQTAQAN